MSAANAFAAPPPDIATRAELDQRLVDRPAPAVAQHLTPSGWESAETERQVDNANENRIAELRSSLGDAHETLDTDMRLAQLRGQARTDFGHSR